MHGISHLLHKHNSRKSSPPLEKEDSTENLYSSLSCSESRNLSQNENISKAIPINYQKRSSYSHRSPRGSSRSSFEIVSSPRDRYENFACYFHDVEGNGSPTQNVYHTHHHDSRIQQSDSKRHQIEVVNTYQASRFDYRHFISPLYNDAMDDIQETEYSKCEHYGEINSVKFNHVPYKNRFDNKNFAKTLTGSSSGGKDQKDHSFEIRGSTSNGSEQRHRHHSIQELIRTFGKKVGHWRHDGQGGRPGSCAMPVNREEPQVANSEAFRSRSKSLDADHLHRKTKRPLLEDCGATYQIFEKIVKEGAFLRHAASQDLEQRRSSLGHVQQLRNRASDAFLDPHHAAMLFRDSRGLPVADPFLEKVSFSDLGKNAM